MATIEMHPSSSLFRCHKAKVPSEACNGDAFILSLREHSDDLSTLHSSGYYKVPHVGVYGDSYDLTQPMFLMSLPPLPCSLMQLPTRLLNALDVRLSDEEVAKQLVRLSILSAIHKTRLSFANLSRFKGSWVPRGVLHSTDVDVASGDLDFSSRGSSTIGNMSSKENSDNEGEEEEEEEEENTKEVYILAKKIVRKAIRLACKRWEDEAFQNSIDYLISNTKKMKISVSPEPPNGTIASTKHCSSKPNNRVLKKFPLHQCQTESRGHSFVPVHEVGSAIAELREESYMREKGKKRQRSQSHDASMISELDRLHVQRGLGSKSLPDYNHLVAARRNPSENAHSRVNDLIANIQQLSIQEEDTDEEEEEEEEFVVLDAITKALPEYPSDDSKTPTSSSVIQSSTPQDFLASACDEVSNMDLYVILHTKPRPGLCQKFLCANMNEVNLVYHCWLYGDVPMLPSTTVSDEVFMGVFKPSPGVLPVHQNLVDAGVAFDCIKPRTVCIHNSCFSPENAQLQLLPPDNPQSLSDDLHTFYSAARHGDRRVAAFHIVPGSESIEADIKRAIVDGGNFLEGVLSSLSDVCPGMANQLKYLLAPLSYHCKYSNA